MSLPFGFKFGLFSCLDWGYRFWGRMSGVKLPFLLYNIRGDMLSTQPTTGEVKQLPGEGDVCQFSPL